MTVKRPHTERIIREDYKRVKAFEDVFQVKMPAVNDDGSIRDLSDPYPRLVNGVERGGHRITDLGRKAVQTGIPVLYPIIGRNSAQETLQESLPLYETAEEMGLELFHFVHVESTRHIDPLDGIDLIEQSRGKGGITPAGDREFVAIGGGSRHPLRINVVGDTPHISIINTLIAGFDAADVGPIIHAHFGGRGIHDFKTKVSNGFKAIQICAENNIFLQLDSHKHVNNIGGTDGMGLALCLLAEGLAVLAGLPSALSAIQINVAGINLLADLAVMKAFQETMYSEFLVVVPETFQNPPANLYAEQAHFARMAISAKLGGANFYRPKAAESVGIPTGVSMANAVRASQNVFENTCKLEIKDPFIEERKREIQLEAMAVLTAALKKEKMIETGAVDETFWRTYAPEELIALIVEAGRAGILDTPRAAGWDLKRFVRTHRDVDGIRRYVPGYTPLGVDQAFMPQTTVAIKVPEANKVTRSEKVVLATVGADAHVEGINQVREGFESAGFEVIYMRGMNIPEAVAEVAAETNASIIGASNLLGLGIDLLPRLDNRLKELGIRDKVILLGGGRIAEKEEEHQLYEDKISNEGPGFMGVDAFFGPGSVVQDIIDRVDQLLAAKGRGEA